MDEKVAICLHEVNHRLGYHSLYSIADNSLSISLLSTIVCFSGDSIPINSDKTKNRNTVLLILCLCFLNEFVLSHWISRQLEWKSDDYAIKLGYGKHLASGFERIVKYYEAEKQKPLKWYQKIMTWTDEFLSDHPDIHERIKNALEKSSNVSKNKDQFIINSINNLKSQEEEIESYDTVAKS
jgi:Zn-dependent protease with chaperone function